VNVARVNAIYRKDLRDALRDSRFLIAILMPLLIGLLYSFMFDDDTRPTAKLGVVTSTSTQLPAALRAETQDAMQLEVEPFDDQASLTAQVRDKEVDVGLIIPGDFDEALERGSSPKLTVILPASPSFGGDYVAAMLDRVTQSLSGQAPAATVARVTLPAAEGSSESAFTTLGARKTFVLVAVILLLSMIAVYALPAVLTEETEKRTVEALTLIASDAEVILAKALFGITYCVVSVPLMLAITRVVPEDVALFVVAIVLTSVALVGLGLLLGGLLRTQTQLNTWSSVALLPLVAPAVVIQLPLPGWIDAIVSLLPTAQTMRLGVNALSGRQLYEAQWLSVAILLGWAVVAYGLVWWRLSRRDAAA
jgi:ABC-type transport system involved in multi-copper enzyme maturation permease subunit